MKLRAVRRQGRAHRGDQAISMLLEQGAPMGRLARRHKQKRRDLKIAPFLSVNGGRYKDRTCDPFHVKATLELTPSRAHCVL